MAIMAVGVTALEPMTVDTQVGIPSPARQPPAIQIPRPKDDGGTDDGGSALREARRG